MCDHKPEITFRTETYLSLERTHASQTGKSMVSAEFFIPTLKELALKIFANAKVGAADFYNAKGNYNAKVSAGKLHSTKAITTPRVSAENWFKLFYFSFLIINPIKLFHF